MDNRLDKRSYRQLSCNQECDIDDIEEQLVITNGRGYKSHKQLVIE